MSAIIESTPTSTNDNQKTVTVEEVNEQIKLGGQTLQSIYLMKKTCSANIKMVTEMIQDDEKMVASMETRIHKNREKLQAYQTELDEYFERFVKENDQLRTNENNLNNFLKKMLLDENTKLKDDLKNMDTAHTTMSKVLPHVESTNAHADNVESHVDNVVAASTPVSPQNLEMEAID